MIYYLHQVICRQERSDKSVIVSTYFTAAETNKDIQRHRRLLLTSAPGDMFKGKPLRGTTQQSAVSLPQLPARKYPELLRSCRVGPGGPAIQYSENSAAQLKEGGQNSASG